MSELSDAQRETLRAVCDTVVPRFERDDDPHGLWARKATDLGIDQGVEQLLAGMPDEQQAGMAELLDGLAEAGITRVSQRSREQILKNVAMMGPEAAAGVNGLIAMTLFLHYGAPDPATGMNPNWETFGYPGPRARRRPSRRRSSRSSPTATRSSSRPTSASSARAQAAA